MRLHQRVAGPPQFTAPDPRPLSRGLCQNPVHLAYESRASSMVISVLQYPSSLALLLQPPCLPILRFLVNSESPSGGQRASQPEVRSIDPDDRNA